MNTLLRALKWLVKAVVFFALFAFALNNPELVTVHWFFGQKWTAPLVLVLLVVFTAGVVVGVLGMLPGWWARKRDPLVAATPHTGTAQPASAKHPSSGPSTHPDAKPAQDSVPTPVVTDAVAIAPARSRPPGTVYPGAEHGV